MTDKYVTVRECKDKEGSVETRLGRIEDIVRKYIPGAAALGLLVGAFSEDKISGLVDTVQKISLGPVVYVLGWLF